MLEVFKALASAERIAIIELLQNGSHNVTDIADMIKLTQSPTSQHLAKLRKAGIVIATPSGNAVYYSLEPSFNWPPKVFR